MVRKPEEALINEKVDGTRRKQSHLLMMLYSHSIRVLVIEMQMYSSCSESLLSVRQPTAHGCSCRSVSVSMKRVVVNKGDDVYQAAGGGSAGECTILNAFNKQRSHLRYDITA